MLTDDNSIVATTGLCWSVPHVYSMQQLFLGHGPNGSIIQQELAGLLKFSFQSLWAMEH